MAVAAVYRINERYLPNVEILLSAVAFCAFGASCLLLHFDQMDGRVLNPPTPRILTKAQAVAQSFEETEFLLDFNDQSPRHEEPKKKLRRGRNHRD